MLVKDESFETQDDSSILHPSSRTLFRYWETIRAERPAPTREDLDLKKIRSLVPHLYIGEYVESAQTFRYRLAGTAICELYRRELTGTSMASDWDLFENDVIVRFLTGTMTMRQPSILRFRAWTDRDEMVGCEMTAFPLTAADGQSTHIVGGIFPFHQPTLAHDGLARFELSAARHIWIENLPVEVAGPRKPASPRRVLHVIAGGRS